MTPRKPNPQQPNLRPDVDTSEIVRRYQAGESSKAIAADLGCAGRTVILRLASAGVPMRQRGKIKTYPGLHSPAWKGDGVSYVQFHRRVRDARGTASRCERCERTDSGVCYDWANLTGNYADTSDYARLCRPCHRRYDYARRKAAVIETIRASTDSARALERQYGIDHRVIREIRAGGYQLNGGAA